MKWYSSNLILFHLFPNCLHNRRIFLISHKIYHHSFEVERRFFPHFNFLLFHFDHVDFGFATRFARAQKKYSNGKRLCANENLFTIPNRNVKQRNEKEKCMKLEHMLKNYWIYKHNKMNGVTHTQPMCLFLIYLFIHSFLFSLLLLEKMLKNIGWPEIANVAFNTHSLTHTQVY